MASLAFFALLPLTTACQILGTFEKFPESLSAKSARFFQPIAAFREFRRAGHVPPSPDFRPSALSFDLESQLIGLRSLFLGLGEFFGVSMSGLLSINSVSV